MAITSLSTLPDPDLLGITCRSPAEHRAAVSEAGTSMRTVLGWPTAERLSRLDLSGLAALVLWRDLMEPTSPVCGMGTDDQAIPEASELEIRPSISEIVASYMRPAVVRHRQSGGTWESAPAVSNMTSSGAHVMRGSWAMLGTMRFNITSDKRQAGLLVSWSRSAFDEPEPVVERHRVRSRPCSASSGATMALDVESGATRIPMTNLAAKAEAEMWRGLCATSIRKAVGSRHALILDLAISSATAAEIGEEFGYQGKYAERKGVALIGDAVAALRSHLQEAPPTAANDNDPGPQTAVAA
ncbi:hypothetical protein [Roseixanthobacter pseudopolyaromaticivorans]|uniref:hypothetical protein n=1 Tax=Xanthobacteraceae TaxID=335928 RepID=UPI0037289AB4